MWCKTNALPGKRLFWRNFRLTSGIRNSHEKTFCPSDSYRDRAGRLRSQANVQDPLGEEEAEALQRVAIQRPSKSLSGPFLTEFD